MNLIMCTAYADNYLPFVLIVMSMDFLDNLAAFIVWYSLFLR